MVSSSSYSHPYISVSHTDKNSVLLGNISNFCVPNSVVKPSILTIILSISSFEKGISSQRIQGNTLQEKAMYFQGRKSELSS